MEVGGGRDDERESGWPGTKGGGDEGMGGGGRSGDIELVGTN